ncbi:hypothetical protein [Nocardia farcinica]|uniref:hypothetical protein n=1 Tax=Nocardia farcinica TaxID=37329 RepID=UPI001895581C|nr:hypothetical protein [Nocardia farcinica]MBF6293953.1 hypothetical protein [Nocardia farcinica]MBF6380372.1 hypothetical protein [Nocardia farcinica]MBF6575157.1 hypothetical protein [Nocardia farcinica]
MSFPNLRLRTRIQEVTVIPDSPTDAFGSYAATLNEIIVDVVRTRHGYAADAHQAAHTRNTRGYSTLWQDLLVDVQDAFVDRGHDLHRLPPAGHKVPVVNVCIVYVWRVPASGDPVHFAASPMKMACFNAPLPEPTLFGLDFMGPSTPTAVQSGSEPEQSAGLEAVMGAVDGKMPVVLVKVYSSPWQLQAIDWAVAELDRETGEVSYRGEETIWQAEPATESDASDVESFSDGEPIEPVVEPRKQEGLDPDAR